MLATESWAMLKKTVLLCLGPVDRAVIDGLSLVNPQRVWKREMPELRPGFADPGLRQASCRLKSVDNGRLRTTISKLNNPGCLAVRL